MSIKDSVLNIQLTDSYDVPFEFNIKTELGDIYKSEYYSYKKIYLYNLRIYNLEKNKSRYSKDIIIDNLEKSKIEIKSTKHRSNIMRISKNYKTKYIIDINGFYIGYHEPNNTLRYFDMNSKNI